MQAADTQPRGGILMKKPVVRSFEVSGSCVRGPVCKGTLKGSRPRSGSELLVEISRLPASEEAVKCVLYFAGLPFSIGQATSGDTSRCEVSLCVFTEYSRSRFF